MTGCKYGFPPLSSTRDLFANFLDTKNDPKAAAVVENWIDALNNGTITGHRSGSRKGFEHASRAAAALLILSLVISFVNAVCTILSVTGKLGNFFWKWSLGLLLFDFVFLIGCFGLTQKVKDQNELAFGIVEGWLVYDVADRSLGATFPVLLLALILKVATVPIIGPVLFVCAFILLAIVVALVNCFCHTDGVESDDPGDG